MNYHKLMFEMQIKKNNYFKSEKHSTKMCRDNAMRFTHHFHAVTCRKTHFFYDLWNMLFDYGQFHSENGI